MNIRLNRKLCGQQEQARPFPNFAFLGDCYLLVSTSSTVAQPEIVQPTGRFHHIVNEMHHPITEFLRHNLA